MSAFIVWPDYRFAFEQTANGQDLVVWMNKTLDWNTRDEHRAEFVIVQNQP